MYISKYKILHPNSLITIAKSCKKVLRLIRPSTTKVKAEKKSFIVKNSDYKTVIAFKFDRHKNLSTLKSDIHLGLAASTYITFLGR